MLLGLTAIALLPINWLGAALMVLAFVLFVLEAKIASRGILGGGGAVAMVLGALMLIDSPVPEMRIRLEVALAVALPFAIITTMFLTLVLRARRTLVVTGSEGMIGETGTAVGPRAGGKSIRAPRILGCDLQHARSGWSASPSLGYPAADAVRSAFVERNWRLRCST